MNNNIRVDVCSADDVRCRHHCWLSVVHCVWLLNIVIRTVFCSEMALIRFSVLLRLSIIWHIWMVMWVSVINRVLRHHLPWVFSSEHIRIHLVVLNFRIWLRWLLQDWLVNRLRLTPLMVSRSVVIHVGNMLYHLKLVILCRRWFVARFLFQDALLINPCLRVIVLLAMNIRAALLHIAYRSVLFLVIIYWALWSIWRLWMLCVKIFAIWLDHAAARAGIFFHLSNFFSD